MNKNLLIVGAGVYGIVASDIAYDMGIYEKIAFVDDEHEVTATGEKVVGKTKDLAELNCEYSNIIVAIGSPDVRLNLLKKIHEETSFRIVALVSPRAYVAHSAQVMPGCIVEPMAVVQSMSILATGCIVSAGAVVNHTSMCCDGVHVDCNATVAASVLVPAGTKIKSGEVFSKKDIGVNDLFFNPEDWARRLKEMNTPIEKRTPVPIDGKLYNFDDVM